jgi:DNA-binding NtrC family response regulator
LALQREGRAVLKILVIDNEEALREAISEALREGGHHPLEAHSIEQARELLARHAIDAIVLDLVMRDATSEELLADVSSKIATVLTSADVTARSAALAAKYAVPLLRKPFDLDDVLPTVLRAHEARYPAAP